MKQLVLDVGLPRAPSLANFFAGPNQAALMHLDHWLCAMPDLDALRPALTTYLWGSSGSGKTHLLQGLAQELAERGASAGWLDPETRAATEFQPSWSALFIDNVDELDTLQQQLAFNWFINAQSHQRAVFATGSLPPADLPLRDDLRSRLGWGHVFALQPLSDADRRVVLQQKAGERGLVLSNEVLDFIQNRFSRDLGTLIELLDRLDDYAWQTQRNITIAMIKTMLNNL